LGGAGGGYKMKKKWAMVLLAIGILGVIGGGIYGVSNYGSTAWHWVAKEYSIIQDKAGDIVSSITAGVESSGEAAAGGATQETRAKWAKIPEGYYESDSHTWARTITIDGYALTMDTKSRITPMNSSGLPFPQLGIFTYEYKPHKSYVVDHPPAEPCSLTEARYIWLQDVVSGRYFDLNFRYIEGYNIFTIEDENGEMESFRLKG
jgi:hypothetical protein